MEDIIKHLYVLSYSGSSFLNGFVNALGISACFYVWDL